VPDVSSLIITKVSWMHHSFAVFITNFFANFLERRNHDVGETPYRAGPDGPEDAEENPSCASFGEIGH
jgi:hypothetical protein